MGFTKPFLPFVNFTVLKMDNAFMPSNRLAILSNFQAKQADQHTISSGISGTSLMQNAATALFFIIQTMQAAKGAILVLTGPGNNGGDGFALALLLKKHGFCVTVSSGFAAEKLPPDAAFFAQQYQKQYGAVLPLEATKINNYSLIVDGIFGAGLNKILPTVLINTIEKINALNTPVVAIDLPTGVSSDTGQVMGAAIECVMSVTFSNPKIGHVLCPGADYCGEIITKPIGILDESIKYAQPNMWVNHPRLWQTSMPKIDTKTHKYSRGVTSIIGAKTLTGASILAAKTAIYSGSGLVRVFCPASAHAIYQQHLPEVVLHPFDSIDQFCELLSTQKIQALLIGPGLLEANDYLDMLINQLKTDTPQLVIDASMLGAIANHQTNRDGGNGVDSFFKLFKKPAILTPHVGEFKRLFPKLDLSDKRQAVSEAAKHSNCVVVLKGFDTLIAHPNGGVIVNTQGCQYLSTAGTGDVLAGLITSLGAQNMNPFLACAAATYLHNQAGHFLGANCVAGNLPYAISNLRSRFYL